MTGKITDARIKELQSLQKRKNEIAEKLRAKQAAMQDLLDAMDEATQDSTQSSSRTALEKHSSACPVIKLVFLSAAPSTTINSSRHVINK
ncbi:hypothetical protein ACEPPN_019121 [Leptodophora sp. 'Broadleaf-Isolate-01']